MRCIPLVRPPQSGGEGELSRYTRVFRISVYLKALNVCTNYLTQQKLTPRLARTSTLACSGASARAQNQHWTFFILCLYQYCAEWLLHLVSPAQHPKQDSMRVAQAGTHQQSLGTPDLARKCFSAIMEHAFTRFFWSSGGSSSLAENPTE